MVTAAAKRQQTGALWTFLGVTIVLMGAALSGAAQTARSSATANVPQAQADAPLDLNTATLEQLKALPGMGAVYARRIIEGRPYTAKHQLLTRGILPQEAYDKMKNSVVAHHLSAR